MSNGIGTAQFQRRIPAHFVPRELLPLYCKTGLLNSKSLVKCFWVLPLDFSNAVFGYLSRVWRLPMSPCGE